MVDGSGSDCCSFVQGLFTTEESAKPALEWYRAHKMFTIFAGPAIRIFKERLT